ncbi:hypothetical protein L7F22_031380 [Adiantum nelumboides]|nr:hypothetical protein [Adiantum nelumboides]
MEWSYFQETEERRKSVEVQEIIEEEDLGIHALGADQVLSILERLPVPCVLTFGMTCRRFRELANTDALWSRICRREWGSSAVDAWPCLGTSADFRWKDLHRQMLALGSISWHMLRQGDIAPAPRASHSMVTTSEKIIIFGGGHDGGKIAFLKEGLTSLS